MRVLDLFPCSRELQQVTMRVRLGLGLSMRRNNPGPASQVYSFLNSSNFPEKRTSLLHSTSQGKASVSIYISLSLCVCVCVCVCVRARVLVCVIM